MLDPYRFALVAAPATIFGAGDTGGFWDFTNASTLFADTARTTPASLDGSVLGVADLSGKSYHLNGVATLIRRSGYLETGTSHLLGIPGASGRQVGGATGFTGYCAFRLASLTGSGEGGDPHSALIGADFQFYRVAQALHVLDSGLLYDARFYDQSASLFDQAGGAVNISAGVTYYASVETTTTEIALRRNGVISGTPVTTATRACSVHSVQSGLWIGCDANGSASGPVIRRVAVGSRLYAAFWINRPITTDERTTLDAWFAAVIGL